METVRFDELDLCQEILRGVKEMGFEEASPIQAQAIPVAMQGYDCLLYTSSPLYEDFVKHNK